MGFIQGFLEKALLLLLTAGLSGFLIPYILKQIDARKLQEQKEFDARKLQEQKEFDASLIRENNILEAQIRLLENLSAALWELQLLALAVSYYQVHPHPERYKLSLKNYDEKSWGLFKDVRCEISKAARLVSRKKYDNLLEFFNEKLIQEVDEGLMHLVDNHSSLEMWEEYYGWILKKFPQEIDNIITPLAEELRLASPKAQLNNSGASNC